MIDLLLLAISLGCGASILVVAPSAWTAAFVAAATGLLAAALVFRRTGFLVASVALTALCQTAVYAAGPVPRLWQALIFGFALLVLLDVGWDRLEMVRTSISPRAYRQRIRYLVRCGAASASAVLVAVSLGYAAARYYDLRMSFVAAVCLAVGVGGAVAALVLPALKRRDSD